MFLEAALLVGLWTLPVAAHRPQKMFSLSLPEGGEGLQQNAHEQEDEFTATMRKNGTHINMVSILTLVKEEFRWLFQVHLRTLLA